MSIISRSLKKKGSPGKHGDDVKHRSGPGRHDWKVEKTVKTMVSSAIAEKERVQVSKKGDEQNELTNTLLDLVSALKGQQ